MVPVLLGALLATSSTAEAQFRGDARRVIPGGGFFPGRSAGPVKLPVADPAGPHSLEYSDGHVLHGTLSGIDTATGQLQWQREDFSAPITLPLDQVYRLHLPRTVDTAPATSSNATVKLIGSDWLTGELLGLQDGVLRLRLGDGSTVGIKRQSLDWIYLSEGAAPECYEGPTSMAGWVAENGWTFREGALRTSMPTPVSRFFETLPDRVEYVISLDQAGEGSAFALTLHGNGGPARGVEPGNVQITLQGTELQFWAYINNEMKIHKVDLGEVLRTPGKLGGGWKPGRNGPLRLAVLEDWVEGRLIVLVDGRKATEWKVTKGKPGQNRGALVFQPTTWTPGTEQALTYVRVAPWDGQIPQPGTAAAGSDTVAQDRGEVKQGQVERITGDKVRVRGGAGTVELARDRVRLIRLNRPAAVADEEVATARLRMAPLGEFDVVSIAFRDGKLALKTTFAGEMVLGLSTVNEIQLSRASRSAAKPGDMLVFGNGDRLPGALEGIAGEGGVSWRAPGAEGPVEIRQGSLAGMILAGRPAVPATDPGVLARLRNGDSLPGTFVTLDPAHLVLDAPGLGQIQVPAAQLQALFFAHGGMLPVHDAGTRPRLWTAMPEVAAPEWYLPRPDQRFQAPAPVKVRERSPWQFFAGKFSLAPLPANLFQPASSASPSLAYTFDAMPDNVEFAFTVRAQGEPVAFYAQLFNEPDEAGYMLQYHTGTVYIHDLRPRGRGGARQQVQVQGKLTPAVNEGGVHHFRLLAERTSGRLIIMVDGAVVGRFGPKPGEAARSLGQGLTLSPQSGQPCAFADLWIGPWNGRVPGESRALPTAAPHTVILANGDETEGTVLHATPTFVKLEAAVGAMDLPVERLTMIDFGAAPAASAAGRRLRLGNGMLVSVTKLEIAGDVARCTTEAAGDLQIPLAAVQEVTFGAPIPASLP